MNHTYYYYFFHSKYARKMQHMFSSVLGETVQAGFDW